MAPKIISAVAKRVVDFATLPALGTEDIVLADKLDLPHSLEMTMLVRVHAHSVTSSSTISIMAMPQLWTPEDPDKSFVATSLAGPPAVLDLNTPVPGYYTRFLRTVGSNSLGPMARILARGVKQVAGGMAATISVDVCAKDGTSFLPTHLPNCVLWLHADDYNPVTGAWPDRSGKGNDGSQPSAAARPKLETSFRGLNDVLFDGADDFVQANGVASSLSGTDIPFSVVYLFEALFISPAPVYYLNHNAGTGLVWSGATSLDYSCTRKDDGAVQKVASSASPLGTNVEYAVTERFSGTTMDVNVNGVPVITAGDLNLVGAVTLNQMFLGVGPPSFGNIRLREFAMYAATHTNTNLALVANGMRERAGMPPF